MLQQDADVIYSVLSMNWYRPHHARRHQQFYIQRALCEVCDEWSLARPAHHLGLVASSCIDSFMGILFPGENIRGASHVHLDMRCWEELGACLPTCSATVFSSLEEIFVERMSFRPSLPLDCASRCVQMSPSPSPSESGTCWFAEHLSSERERISLDGNTACRASRRMVVVSCAGARQGQVSSQRCASALHKSIGYNA